MMRTFTTEEMLSRYEDRREIKNLMVKFFTADFFYKREYRMFDAYWSSRDDICLGVNEGWYLGRSGVKSYFDGLTARTRLESKLIQKLYPNCLGSLDDDSLYGVGILNVKPLDTSVIEIAGDSHTAKSIFTIRGANTKLTSQGLISYWEWGWVAADWVYEGGSWKVWHMLYVQDLDVQDGINWASEPKEFDEVELLAPMKEFTFPEPTVKTTVRERYHTMRRFTPPPPYPRPYETFEETFSYAYRR